MAHRLSGNAEAEFDSIWYYIATRSGNPDIADRVIDAITERFFLLSRFPHLGRRRDHDLRPGLRSSVIGEYVILYRVEEADVLVLHVMRGSQDIRSHLSDL